MSKAEDLSKQYRDFREQCGVKDPVMLNEIEEAYFEGYHKAEKDLELIWQDVDTIYNLLGEEFNYQLEYGKRPQKEACQEVLKRFKERKEK